MSLVALRPARAAGLARRHWLLAILLLAGLVLRVLAQVTYRPALLYIDTIKYLFGNWPGSDPLGYGVILKAILAVGSLATVAALQHLLGLAMAAGVYAVLLRRGAPRWLAALATGPVLLDAYQLQMEQTIMPDVWFEAIVVAGLVVLLWRPAVSLPAATVAGLLLGSSATVRQLGEILIAPALVYLVLAGGGWRRVTALCATLAAAFAAPILVYCTGSALTTGHFWLSAGQPTSGRLAAAADCATLTLPAAVRPLCPDPAAQARGADWLEHSGHSPLHTAPIPPGAGRQQLIRELSSAVEHQQPLRVAAAVARDSVRLFTLRRGPRPGITPIGRWQFQRSYPVFPPEISLGSGGRIIIGTQRHVFGRFLHHPLSPADGGPARVAAPLAAFLHDYQLSIGYTPGPLLALLALLAAAGTVLALRLAPPGWRRRARRPRQSPAARPLALACLAWTGVTVAVLLVPDVFEFSWRYQLPAVVMLPPAGALGLCALLQARWRPRGHDARPGPAAPPPPNPAASSLLMPSPARSRPAPASTWPTGRGRPATPAATPRAKAAPSARRSPDRANVRAHRRSVEPPYRTRSTGPSGAAERSIQILFRTS